MDCFVIDISTSGVAVSADVQPEIGTPLAVGSLVGRVVRHLDDGFAVQFVQVVDADGLEQKLVTHPADKPLERAAATLRPVSLLSRNSARFPTATPFARGPAATAIREVKKVEVLGTDWRRRWKFERRYWRDR